MIDLESLTLGQVMEKGAESVPDKTAVVFKKERKTYKEINAMADGLASGLSELGIEKGDRIAIYMRSSIEFVATFYALEKLGVIVAWVNPMYRKNEAEFILNNSEARGVFIFRDWEGYDYLEAISGIRKDLPHLEFIFLVGEGEGKFLDGSSPCFPDVVPADAHRIPMRDVFVTKFQDVHDDL